MKQLKRLTRLISAILAVIFTASLIPGSLAANDVSILTKLGHISTDIVALSGNTRNITLTVPYTYPASAVDLSNGLKIDYDTTQYKSVVATPDSSAVIGGSAVKLAVTFFYVSDTAGTTKYETDYSVNIVRAAQKMPTFSGFIEREAKLSGGSAAVSFAASDFTGKYSQNEGDQLGYIKITGSNLNWGAVELSDGTDVLDQYVAADSLDGLKFVATSAGVISYNVYAYAGSDKTNPVGMAVVTITIYDTPVVLGTVSKTTYTNSSAVFTSSDFANCCNLYAVPLESVTITPDDTACGKWYLGTQPMTGATSVAADQISTLSFAGISEGTASFHWSATTEGGTSADGNGTITILTPDLQMNPFNAPSYIAKGSIYTVNPSDFTYTPSSASLTYIKIVSVPSSADGYLYLTTALAISADGSYNAISAKTPLSAGTVIPFSYVKYLRVSTNTTSSGASITFTWTGTADSSAKSAAWANTASYTVEFISGGNVSYTTDIEVPVTLNGTDFAAQYASSSGGTLSYVNFTLPSNAYGTLYYNYDISAKTGTSVSSSTKYYPNASPNISRLTFVPASGYKGMVSIAYNAYSAAGTYTVGTLTITVSSAAAGTLTYKTDKNAAVQFDAADFMKAFSDATGATLSSVAFTLPATSYGTLYYNYTSSYDYDAAVSASQSFSIYSPQYLSYVSFVPYQDYTGMVSIYYTAYSTSGASFSGKVIIFVVDSPAGIVSYSSKVNGSVQLSAGDFSKEFISVTGSVLSYVTFTPPAATVGSLSYGYSATSKGTSVSSSTKYYNGATPDISDITFIPAKDYVGGAEIKYTVYTASGASYAGKLKISVGAANAGTVSYSTDVNTSFTMNANDFTSKFFLSTGGSKLSYVTFSLPSSAYGKLYCSGSDGGGALTADAKYYSGGSPYLTGITFVPATGYVGTFSVTFTGYDTDGNAYPGRVSVTVGSSAAGTVYYNTNSLTPVSFGLNDFKTAFAAKTSNAISYVKFTLPSAIYGTLYCGYSSSSYPGTAVSAGTAYYVNTWPYISGITFVPASGFSGTLAVSYTAYDFYGNAYNGIIIIAVSGNGAGAVSYVTDINTPVKFYSEDFNAAFLGETGSNLYYVKFTLPTASYGTLYYGYTSPSSTGTAVLASMNYCRNAYPLISNITFVPGPGYAGNVAIPYAAYSSDGKSYSGTITINVVNPGYEPFEDVGASYSWAKDAVNYLYGKNIIKGSGSGQFRPGDSMSRGDFMLMVYRALNLSPSTAGSFPDVAVGSYYYEAIASAKALGIAKGTDGLFCPDAAISRQDAMAIIMRALTAVGKAPPSGSAADITAFDDAAAVSDYAVSSVAALVKAGIVGGSGGKLCPQDMISRAEMATVIYRVLTK